MMFSPHDDRPTIFETVKWPSIPLLENTRSAIITLLFWDLSRFITNHIMERGRKKQWKYWEMELCVKEWDGYDGPLNLKHYHKEQKLAEKHGIPYTTFWDHAREDKSLRISFHPVTEDELEHGRFLSRRDMAYCLHDSDLSMGQLTAATEGGPNDPKLKTFERCNLIHQCNNFEWWLNYYSYDVDHRIRREVSDLVNRLTFKVAEANNEEKKRHRAEVEQSQTRKVKRRRGGYQGSWSSLSWDEMKMAEWRSMMEMTWGGFNETRSNIEPWWREKVADRVCY